MSGTRGQSRYHYYGLAVKETSPYYDPGIDYERLNTKKEDFDANISTQPTLERRPQFNPGATLYLGVILMRHASKLPFLVWCPLSKFGWNLIQ